MADGSAGFSTKDLLQLGLVLGVGYAVYLLLQKVGALGAQAASAATNFTADQLAQLYTWFTSLTAAPAIAALGSVNLPNGQSFPVNSLSLRTDSAGNVYFMTVDGTVWQIGARGADNNWTASVVPAPDFGVTGTSW